MASESVVICKMPKAGLGNQLFPLLKAFVFGSLNNLPVHVTGYHQIKLGPWLRREKTKRKYNGFFSFQKNLISYLLERTKLNLRPGQIEAEPTLQVGERRQGQIFLFSTMPSWENYFEGLKEHRKLVLEIFQKVVEPNVFKKLEDRLAPIIGVHIRMGDFRKLNVGENFSSVGAVRTPEAYFLEIISSIRKMHGSSLPVTVFSDGHKEELLSILSLENVQLSEGNSDLEDLILLSRSKIIVTSAGSTFSYWSAFLADAPVIMHPDHLHQPLRSNEVNNHWYEGPFDFTNELLRRNVADIEN